MECMYFPALSCRSHDNIIFNVCPLYEVYVFPYAGAPEKHQSKSLIYVPYIEYMFIPTRSFCNYSP